MELTILMPCLNEEETVGGCVSKAAAFLVSAGIDGEVLLVDNGSSDRSVEIAERAGARVVLAAERGYGSALKKGIEAARGRYIIMGDADGSYDFSALEPFIKCLRSGADLVMGNRFRGGIDKGAMPLLHRYLGNPVLSSIGRLFFRSRIGDFHCGLRGFNKERIKKLNLAAAGMEFASEMVVKAALQGLDVKEVPTRLQPDGRSRPPHLRSWRDGWRHLKLLLLMCPRWLFYYPGVTLLLLGVFLIFWIVLGTSRIFGLHVDVNTLTFGSAFVIVGVQILTFGLAAQIYADRKLVIAHRSCIYGVMRKHLVEFGVILGGMISVAGLIGAIYSLVYWGLRDFGGLIPTESLRIVIPSSTAVVVGIQIVFSSFFLTLVMDD